MIENADESAGAVGVIGTAHVSSESAREVEEAIREERPDVVAVELDEGRYRRLKGETKDQVNARDLIRGNSAFQFLVYWLMSYLQTRFGEKFDIEPGADMLSAVETAEELGIDVALVDRDIQVTIQRFWARMTLPEKVRIVGGLLVGVGDARSAGLVGGVVVGIVLGPVFGLFGGTLGITDAVLTHVAGGVLLAVAVGVGLQIVGSVHDRDDTVPLAIVGGLIAGLVGGIALGLGDGIVTATLSPIVRGAVGYLILGLTCGLAVGAVVGSIVDRVGPTAVDPDDLEGLTEGDLTDGDLVSTMLEEFRELSPGGAEVLVDERDAYIARQLVALRESGLDVVTVVGAGHAPGIQRYLADPERLPPHESLAGDERGRRVPLLKFVGVLISLGFVGFFASLVIAGVRDAVLFRVFAAWFLVNGVFAAGFARLSGARWRSALVGGAVAWLTSINPLLAPGWFVGYLELRYTDVDAGSVSVLNERLLDGEKSVGQLASDLFDVPLFRLVVIVAVTNLGSVVASLLFAVFVLPRLASDLGGIDAVMRLVIQGTANGSDLVWRALPAVGAAIPLHVPFPGVVPL